MESELPSNHAWPPLRSTIYLASILCWQQSKQTHHAYASHAKPLGAKPPGLLCFHRIRNYTAGRPNHQANGRWIQRKLIKPTPQHCHYRRARATSRPSQSKENKKTEVSIYEKAEPSIPIMHQCSLLNSSALSLRHNYVHDWESEGIVEHNCMNYFELRT